MEKPTFATTILKRDTIPYTGKNIIFRIPLGWVNKLLFLLFFIFKYGQEVREKYGEQAVNSANTKLKNMTQAEFAEGTRLGKEVIETLHAAFQIGDPAGELAQKAVNLHQQWLSFYWDNYTKEAHAGVAQMYVDDERFTAYYDQEHSGVAKFLRDAVLIYTGMKQ